MNQMKNFLKSAMQKQKNAIFIHIWWVAPDINSHMSQRPPPAIIRPISQKALLKKMAPTWILVCQNLHFSPRNCTCTFFLFVFFSYLTCYLLLPIFRYRIWKKILWNFFLKKSRAGNRPKMFKIRMRCGNKVYVRTSLVLMKIRYNILKTDIVLCFLFFVKEQDSFQQ